MKKNLFRMMVCVLAFAVALPFAGVFAQDGETAFLQGVVVTDSDLAIYAEQNIGSEVLATVASGSTVDVFEEGDLWSRVGFEGTVGWTFTRLLDISAKPLYLEAVTATRSDLAIRTEPDIAADVIATVPNGTVVGVLLVDGSWAQVFTGEVIGWTFAAELPELTEPTGNLQFAQADGVTQTNSAVALREGPDIGTPEVGVLEAGTAVKVLGYDGVFAFVRSADGLTGWAFTSRFAITPRAYAAGTLNAGPVNFRDAPDGAVVTVLPFESGVLLIGRNEDGSWINVRYPAQIFVDGEPVENAEGWISAEFIDTAYDTSLLPVTG